MASAGLREELGCSVCLSLYTDPLTLRCGHNFCRVCIDQVLNTKDGSGVYSCPECRAEFQERPALQRNITLCNVVENIQSTQPHQDETKIFCNYCIDAPVPAVKSCRLCDASLCDNHLRVHSKAAEHILTEPSTSLENRKCSVHKKILEYYCPEDAACIGVSCSLAGEHQGHQVEMLDEAAEKKKEKLKDVLQKLSTKREKTEERVQSLEERRRKTQEKAAGEEEKVTALFIDIRRRVDDLEKRVRSKISRQEEQVSLSDVIQKLEIKKDELSRKMRDIEELCNMTDPLTVLQGPDTDDLKMATCADIEQNRPETEERFQDNCQVISSRRFSSGRHYWDVEIRSLKVWMVGMCYPSIDRFGYDSYFDHNSKAWSLCGGLGCKYPCSVAHDYKDIDIPHQISSYRFRIYLDYEAGQLSFYELCDPIRHLHTFTATFTEPLHAAFCVCGGYIKILGGSSSCVETIIEGQICPETGDITGEQNLIGESFSQ